MASDLQGQLDPPQTVLIILEGSGVKLTYQALTLLEFLVKNGSERVVDDARAHVSTIKMLRSFHYIDEKGKDQGINGEPYFRLLAQRLSSYSIGHSIVPPPLILHHPLYPIIYSIPSASYKIWKQP